MTDVKSDTEYEPPCAEDVDVAGGTAEAASMVVVIPPSSK
jgi:hypothetical protein